MLVMSRKWVKLVEFLKATYPRIANEMLARQEAQVRTTLSVHLLAFWHAVEETFCIFPVTNAMWPAGDAANSVPSPVGTQPCQRIVVECGGLTAVACWVAAWYQSLTVAAAAAAAAGAV
jgi:hypothetical protein